MIEALRFDISRTHDPLQVATARRDMAAYVAGRLAGEAIAPLSVGLEASDLVTWENGIALAKKLNFTKFSRAKYGTGKQAGYTNALYKTISRKPGSPYMPYGLTDSQSYAVGWLIDELPVLHHKMVREELPIDSYVGPSVPVVGEYLEAVFMDRQL